MKHLYFVRHGQSEMNVSEQWSGSSDTPLTASGRRQAVEAGKQARNLQIDYIVASPLIRAHDTAKLIAKEIGYPIKNIHLNGLFVERHYGELEGQPWSPDLDLDGFADVETTDSVLGRASKALDFLQSLEHQTVLVVSHGSFGRALRHHVQAEFPFSHPHRLGNAEIIQLI